MWIRSQDGNILIKDGCIWVKERTYRNLIGNKVLLRCTYVIMADNRCIAEYNDPKNAVKVMDMLENKINENYQNEMNARYGNAIYNSTIYDVFKMPREEDL